MEEYSPKIEPISGKNNVISDSLSRLHREEDPTQETPFTEEYPLGYDEKFHFMIHNKEPKECFDCYLNYSEMVTPYQSPLYYE